MSVQVEDQSYDYPDNAALMRNMKTGTPVRVFRQGSGSPPAYTYEGLYKVVGHGMEKSSDGPKVGPAGWACLQGSACAQMRAACAA